GRYARALEKLHRLNLMPAVTSGSGVHPSLYDRMIAAGVTPDYRRPVAPTYRRTFGALMAPVALLGAITVAFAVWRESDDRLAPTNLRLALGGDSRDLLFAGAHAWSGGDVRRGSALYGAGLWADPAAPGYARGWRAYAGMLAYARRCDEARAAAEMAGDVEGAP